MNGIALQLAECKRILLTVKLCNTTVWRKAVRWGFSSHYKCLTDLLREADLHLFRKMASNSGHCIHQLLPPTKVLPMKLRDSHCVFALPQCHYNMYKHSFVLRNLFVSAYWFDVRWHCIFCIFFKFWFSAHAMLCLQLADGVWPSFIKRITYLLTYVTRSATDYIRENHDIPLGDARPGLILRGVFRGGRTDAPSKLSKY